MVRRNIRVKAEYMDELLEEMESIRVVVNRLRNENELFRRTLHGRDNRIANLDAENRELKKKIRNIRKLVEE